MPKTLLLDQDAWDLVLDAAGNIAVAGEPYAVAQDVASAIRTFTGDCYYDTAKGIPYWRQILGKYPPMSLVRDRIVTEAKREPGVERVEIVSFRLDERAITGSVLVYDKSGQSIEVGF